LFDAAAAAQVGELIEAVRGVRAFRESEGLRGPLVAQVHGFEHTRDALARLAKLEWGDPGESPVEVAGVLLAAPEVDTAEVERKRVEEREKLQAEIERAKAKLANEGFVAKAPEAVVQGERDKLAELEKRLEELG
jgi:valyl-tRNA synthetase